MATQEELDGKFSKLAIEESRKSKPEDNDPHPLVGAVVVKDGSVLAQAHRGELGAGDHAEYTALEKKLPGEALAGSTVYTTLEPCTARNHPKVPCVERLIERKVTRVVIGMLDPNPKITGKGQLALRKANIETALFPSTLMAEVEELNREFARAQTHKSSATSKVVDDEFLKRHNDRSLDDWYKTANYIYWDRNFNRDTASLFTHLVEVTGGLSLLASSKKKPGVVPEDFIPKSIAWWMALCGKVGVKSVEDMLWTKFPAVCSYCLKCPHDPVECMERKVEQQGPQWEQLVILGTNNQPPHRLSEWQGMFSRIYPAQQTEDFGPSFGRLTEELGELAEALRVFPEAPGYFLSEASDVFAWLMHIQNIIDHKAGTPRRNIGASLEKAFCLAYPDRCLDCNEPRCSCPPILQGTIGRIAHEVPRGRGTYDAGGNFLTPDRTRQHFQLPK